MKLKTMTAILLLFLAILYTGCNNYKQTVTKTEEIKIDIKDELLECEDMPTVPTQAKKQSDISRYILSLWSTADDCKSKLKDIQKIIKKE